MSVQLMHKLSPRMQQAIAELQSQIRLRYPEASFHVTRSPEDAELVLLKPVVDVEDRDEVVDVIIDRLVELQLEEELPLLVVPIRPKSRNQAIREVMRLSPPGQRKKVPKAQL